MSRMHSAISAMLARMSERTTGRELGCDQNSHQNDERRAERTLDQFTQKLLRGSQVDCFESFLEFAMGCREEFISVSLSTGAAVEAGKADGCPQLPGARALAPRPVQRTLENDFGLHEAVGRPFQQYNVPFDTKQFGNTEAVLRAIRAGE